MQSHENYDFLLALSKGIKKSYESPVILLTMKDYALNTFNLLTKMRAVLISTTAPEPVANIIHTFHVEWLHAVQEIENFKKRLNETPREIIIKAINYTVECASNRFNHFQRYIERLQSSMTSEEKHIMHTELTVIKDMRENVYCILQDKQMSFLSQADHTEYYVKVYYEIKELLNWLDCLNNDLAKEFSKALRVPDLPTDLTASLNRIISEIGDPLSDEDNAENHSIKFRVHTQDLKIETVIEKMKAIEKRIRSIEKENKSKLMALQHKKFYLKERLQSMVNLKLSLNALKLQNKESRIKNMGDSQQANIFSHLLPPQERCHLVDNLVRLWDNALRDPDTKSVLSVKYAIETVSNDLDDFTIDNYGRKIYYRDDKIYQLNEKNKLVLVHDDEKHVFFYDDCGRYYISNGKQRIYKDHDSASEYMMDSTGLLVKVKDEKEGIEYIYDHLGRYYVNEHGKHIYREPDSNSEYEKDSFGNLVKVRNDEPLFFYTCTNESLVTNDSNYLKRTVGMALKKCIANVILNQPVDPITYLANCLEKYTYNEEARPKLLENMNQRLAEIELQKKERELHNMAGMQNTSEQSYYVEEEQSFVVSIYSNKSAELTDLTSTG